MILSFSTTATVSLLQYLTYYLIPIISNGGGVTSRLVRKTKSAAKPNM